MIDKGETPTTSNKPFAECNTATLQAITPACVCSLHRVVAQFGLIPDEINQTLQTQREVIQRKLPDIINVLTIVSLLPVLRERFLRSYSSRESTRSQAEDLSQDVVMKILEALFGRWPRGNVRAWIDAIRKNVGIDDIRKQNREVVSRQAVSGRMLDGIQDREAGSVGLDTWDSLSAILTQIDLAVLKAKWDGKSCDEISHDLDIPEVEVDEVFRRVRRKIAPCGQGRGD
jgi:DNA-directed RNA polymerase specialized sigma24 family protein